MICAAMLMKVASNDPPADNLDADEAAIGRTILACIRTISGAAKGCAPSLTTPSSTRTRGIRWLTHTYQIPHWHPTGSILKGNCYVYERSHPVGL